MRYLLPLLLLFVFSCKRSRNEESTQDKKNALARVEEKYLYTSDIKALLPKGLTGNDSARFVMNYIDSWVRQNLLLNKAEANLTDEQKDVQQQLDDYRNSLVTYIYEKELVVQKLDTVVLNAEIEAYYNSHPNDFELKDNIVKVLYVKARRNSPNIKKVQLWYKSDKPTDRKALEDYCHQYAENFYLDDNSWLLFNDLLKEIPIKTYNEELFLQNNRLIEVEDSGSVYFVNIKGFKVKDSQSPLGFEKENIRNIILNKRKLTLVNQMKDDLYKQGLASKKFEIFKNK